MPPTAVVLSWLLQIQCEVHSLSEWLLEIAVAWIEHGHFWCDIL